MYINIQNKPSVLEFSHNIHNYNTRKKNNVSNDFHCLTKTLSHIVLSCKIYNVLEPHTVFTNNII